MNEISHHLICIQVSAGCHINDVMNTKKEQLSHRPVSAGCHINDVMNLAYYDIVRMLVSAGCHINDVMNLPSKRATE